jgi:hypothetical protein
MRVSALITKKRRVDELGRLSNRSCRLSIRELLAMPLPEKSPASAAICLIGGGGKPQPIVRNSGSEVRGDKPLD